MLFNILEIIIIIIIIPIDFIASCVCPNNIDNTFCPIVLLSISPFIADVNNSEISKSKSSL